MLDSYEPDALASIDIIDDDYSLVANQLEKQRQLKARQLNKQNKQSDFVQELMLKEGKFFSFYHPS